jgi:hypothetical protein
MKNINYNLSSIWGYTLLALEIYLTVTRDILDSVITIYPSYRGGHARIDKNIKKALQARTQRFDLYCPNFVKTKLDPITGRARASGSSHIDTS